MTGTETPFQRVVDEMTGGCGCACHTGTGYRSSCEHCWPSPAAWQERALAAEARARALEEALSEALRAGAA